MKRELIEVLRRWRGAERAQRPRRPPNTEGADYVNVRRLSADDSLAELTDLLHRAFAPLGAMGLQCQAVDQSEQVTRQRVGKGSCYVAERNGSLFGTMTLCAPDPDSACPLYRRPDAASVRQFAVLPDMQGRGIGVRLLALAEHWAASRGYDLLALDTPVAATHLLAFYRRRGFEIVECLRFPGRDYSSAILCKPLVAPRRTALRANPV